MDAEVVLVPARWVFFVTAMTLFGSSLLPIYAGNKDRPERLRLGHPTMILLAAAALASAIAWFAILVTQLAADTTPRELLTTAAAVLFETEFGPAWIVRLLAACVLLGSVVVSRRLRTVMVPAAILLGTDAWLGHAAMGLGPIGWAQTGVQLLHLLAAGAWLGALPLLGTEVIRVHRHLDAQAASVLKRFSPAGMLLVGGIAATGAVNTCFLLGFPPSLAGTYGRVLLVKVALFLLMAAVASVNRFHFMPQLERAEMTRAGYRSLSRSILIEMLLGLLILADVSVLGTLNPGS